MEQLEEETNDRDCSDPFASSAATRKSTSSTATTKDIYAKYKTVCENEGSAPISGNRISRLLKEQSFLRITESWHTGGGYEKGSYRVHSLSRDPEIDMKALKS